MKRRKIVLATFAALILTAFFAIAGNNANLKRYFTPKLARASTQGWCYCHLGSSQCMVDSWGNSCGPFGFPCSDSNLCEG